MIITKLKKTGGLYCVFFTGKMKMDDGRWEDSVIYKRIAIDVKPDEDTSELYTRSAESFRAKFELVSTAEFESICGCPIQHYVFPEMGGKFKGIFGK